MATRQEGCMKGWLPLGSTPRATAPHPCSWDPSCPKRGRSCCYVPNRYFWACW